MTLAPFYFISLLFGARAVAQVPPPHAWLAPVGLLRRGAWASVTLALFYYISLLFGARAVAQVPPPHA